MEDIKHQIIRQKLTVIKQLVTKDKNGNIFILANREKNKKFILKYGLLVEDIKDIILDLEVDDYYRGPEIDKDGYDGEIWIFVPNYQDTKLYIKIRLENNILVVCVSIHEYGDF